MGNFGRVDQIAPSLLVAHIADSQFDAQLAWVGESHSVGFELGLAGGGEQPTGRVEQKAGHSLATNMRVHPDAVHPEEGAFVGLEKWIDLFLI